ncbi:hemerythrin domain-containing protein [Catenulispora rubra]|uniref:hemerythrin domain-containing protein n=1 Tax=Catenulispora rubra TaxID=280293 RepID=UPI001891F766|nr:hemerythrin domain-containing protein [Catenulispora rubra]
MASPGGDRAVALSLQLAQAHQRLRDQIAEVRAGLGHRRLSDDTLATHCLAFCDALTSHHRSEDEGMFSDLLRERPDLAPTIAKLIEDHELIAGILSSIRKLADKAVDSGNESAEAIGRELDGLAAIMESHFRYEERTISQAFSQ